LPTISTGRVAGRLAAAVATGPAASSAAAATHAARNRIALTVRKPERAGVSSLLGSELAQLPIGLGLDVERLLSAGDAARVPGLDERADLLA
jgi:hypothetical protein